MIFQSLGLPIPLLLVIVILLYVMLNPSLYLPIFVLLFRLTCIVLPIRANMGGGCNQGSMSAAHLHARAFIDIAVLQNLSLLAYFVDVRTAFASMLWALAITLQTSDAAFCERLINFGFSNREAADIF